MMDSPPHVCHKYVFGCGHSLKAACHPRVPLRERVRIDYGQRCPRCKQAFHARLGVMVG